MKKLGTRIKWAFSLWAAKIESIPVQLSVNFLTGALRKSPNFYYAYQANIAMALRDEIAKLPGHKTVGRVDWNTTCNLAARSFLDNWTRKHIINKKKEHQNG